MTSGRRVGHAHGMKLARLLLLSFLAMPGCYYLSGQYWADQENARLAPFKGQDSSLLIKAFGAPSMIMDDGKGGKIWVYRTVTEHASPARTETTFDKKTGTTTTQSYPGSVTRDTLEELFFIDASGKVYDTAWHNK